MRKGGRVPYREGMTLRDALLSVDWGNRGCPAHRGRNRPDAGRQFPGRQARWPSRSEWRSDSTYLFDRGPNGRYLGPPGAAAQPSGASEVLLNAYDNVLIFRQPDWELQRTVQIAGKVRFPGRYAPAYPKRPVARSDSAGRRPHQRGLSRRDEVLFAPRIVVAASGSIFPESSTIPRTATTWSWPLGIRS